MAGNAWLRRHLPRLPFARRAVRRFMPGETIEEVLDAAERFRPLGIGILLEIWGAAGMWIEAKRRRDQNGPSV